MTIGNKGMKGILISLRFEKQILVFILVRIIGRLVKTNEVSTF